MDRTRGVAIRTEVGLLARKAGTTERIAGKDVDGVRCLDVAVFQKGLGGPNGGVTVAVGQDALELVDQKVGLFIRQALDFELLTKWHCSRRKI